MVGYPRCYPGGRLATRPMAVTYRTHWRTRHDLNVRPSPSEGDALSTELPVRCPPHSANHARIKARGFVSVALPDPFSEPPSAATGRFRLDCSAAPGLFQIMPSIGVSPRGRTHQSAGIRPGANTDWVADWPCPNPSRPMPVPRCSASRYYTPTRRRSRSTALGLPCRVPGSYGGRKHGGRIAIIAISPYQ